ncbi:MAG: hypothetical protein AB7N80_15415 [Bdellovibrionales bacterium]
MKNWLLITLTAIAGSWANAAVQEFTPEEYDQDTATVKELIDSTEVFERYNYCVEDTLTCRTLVILKSKSNGQPIRSWYDVFLSSERAVGSVGYFLSKEGRKFRAVLDRSMDGEINIDLKFTDNQDLRISFDRHGFPTVHDVSLKRLGTPRYIFGDMSYNSREAMIVGHELDSNDPNYKKPVRIIYKRMR